MSSPNTFRVARFVVAGALAALSFGVSAQAGEVVTEVGTARTAIRYADLDLAKQADAQALYGRLQRASSQVCDSYKDSRNLGMKPLYDACYQDTLARAVESVGHAAVKAAYAADDGIRVADRGVKAQAST